MDEDEEFQFQEKRRSPVPILLSTGVFQRRTQEKKRRVDEEEEFQFQEKIMFPSPKCS
jgi:hypothetical protein